MNALDRLRALHAAATQGRLTTRSAVAAYDGEFDCALVDEDSKIIAECFGRVAAGPTGTRSSVATARSFAENHNRMDALIACVDALRAVAPDHPALAPLLEEQP